MTTDWLLMRRAAAELARGLHGGRVTDAGLLDDGRVAVRFGGLRGRGPATLAIDAFGSPPLVSLEDAELSLAVDPGWLRTAGTTLRGMRLVSARGRPGDRVIALGFGTASRFGVTSEAQLVLELVPRYGNIVVLHERVVVAAAKQFSPAENPARAVQVGLPYEPPPLPAASLEAGELAAALAAAPEPAARARALGRVLPTLPRLVADSFVAQAALVPWPSPAEEAAWLLERAGALLSALEGEPDGLGDVFAYRDAAGTLVAAHVVRLAQFAHLNETREPALLPLFAESRASGLRAQRGDAHERRRAGLIARIAKRVRAGADEERTLAARLADAAGRDRLRAIGDALHTHAAEVPAGAASFVPPTAPELRIELDPALDAKENARAYFARYRKAASAVPHLEQRRAALAARGATLEELAFEAERADAATLAELEASLDAAEGRRPRVAAPPARKRAPLIVERPSGARILVGRSPLENAELTFRIARPGDLWFHARGIPGSHVVLQPPPGGAVVDDDLTAAADLAALHSKARSSLRVEIDYTERKHVRKQRDGGPGQVWYTNARTRLGTPGAAGGSPAAQPSDAR